MTPTTDTSSDLQRDADLHAYADDALPPGRRDAVAARLDHDPSARAAVADWRRHADLIRDAASEADDLPADLKTATLERDLRRRLQGRSLRHRATGPRARNIAAGLLVFAAGWGAHGLTQPQSPASPDYPAFVERALSGDLLHASGNTDTLNFPGAQIDQALNLISDEFGYRFQRAQFEIPDHQIESIRYVRYEAEPLALFNYRHEKDGYTILAVERHPPDAPKVDFQTAQDPYGYIAYWSDDHLDYVTLAAAYTSAAETLAAEVSR